MKKVIIAVIGVCAALASCQGTKSTGSFSEIDSLSYAIGMDLANNLGVRALPNNDSSLVVNLITAGFRDAWNGKAQITTEDAAAFIQEFFQVRLPAKAQAEGQAWLDEVKASNPNVQTTASGLMYEIVNAGDPAVKANDTDQLIVNYALSLKDGKVIQQNDSIPIALSGVIPGWKEGMKLVGKGGEITLWVPSQLGYGAGGSGPIPPNSALKFEIKLLDVIPPVQ